MESEFYFSILFKYYDLLERIFRIKLFYDW